MPSCLLTIFFDGREAFRIVLAGPFYHHHGRGRLQLGSHAGAARGHRSALEKGVAGRCHHEAFHRFIPRGTWDPALVEF